MTEEDYNQIEEDLRRKEQEERRKEKMAVSGRSVFQIQQILNQKTSHKEKKKQ
ncbi:MAG: hypothetical protein AAB360_02860 [Patescibacteria group bacterium]